MRQKWVKILEASNLQNLQELINDELACICDKKETNNFNLISISYQSPNEYFHSALILYEVVKNWESNSD